MRPAFATTWKGSVQPRKQRKYQYNAPYHVKGRFLAVHLSPALRKQHATRAARIRKGDKVKVLRGNHKGKEAKVDRVDPKHTKVYLARIEHSKPDGTKTPIGFHPSSLMITELDLEDKKRKAKLEKKKKKE
ncbi:50S ribosomal protein L24 [Candidatus Woesearchaeota archaeon]|nr:50S ribosomal protein L24 [Candidatus Woesearchaeota archaeon]